MSAVERAVLRGPAEAEVDLVIGIVALGRAAERSGVRIAGGLSEEGPWLLFPEEVERHGPFAVALGRQNGGEGAGMLHVGAIPDEGALHCDGIRGSGGAQSDQ